MAGPRINPHRANGRPPGRGEAPGCRVRLTGWVRLAGWGRRAWWVRRAWWARASALLILALAALPLGVRAQVDEDQLGLWNMYFWSTELPQSRWGFQGDAQYRLWNVGNDLEQLLLRGGVTLRPQEGGVLLTLGYANVTTGEFGPGDDTFGENRIYQEAALGHRVGRRFHLRHRFRYEQRWVEGQDSRTRVRYALFLNVPLNRTRLDRGAWYLSFYNELFVNGEEDIGGGREVSPFDRNRTYGALGYRLGDGLGVQLGYMHQETEDFGKGQLQLSLHHAW